MLRGACCTPNLVLPPCHPLYHDAQTELINNIRRNRPRLPAGVVLSPSCIELLGMLLVPRPAERGSLQMFLSSAFLKERDASMTTPGNGDATLASVGHSGEPATPAGGEATRDFEPGNGLHPRPSARADPAPVSGAHQKGDDLQQKSDHPPPLPGKPASSRPSARSRAHGATMVVHADVGRRDEEGNDSETGNGPSRGRRLSADSSANPPSMPDPPDRRETAMPTARSSAANIAVEAGRQVRSIDGSANQGRPSVERKGEWGWKWGPRFGAEGGEGGEGDGAPGLAGIGARGPLPSLPAIPFALEGSGGRQLFAGNMGPVGGGDTPDFTLDLAFAAHPSEDDATASAGVATPPPDPMGPDRSRRKRDGLVEPAEGAGVGVGGGTLEAPAILDSRGKKGLPSGGIPYDGEDAGFPVVVGSNAVVRSRSPSRVLPEPVFYPGRGGSSRGVSISPPRHGQTSSPSAVPLSPPVHTPAGVSPSHPSAGQAERSIPTSPGQYQAARNTDSRCDAGGASGACDVGGANLSPPGSSSGQGFSARPCHPPPVSVGIQHTPGSPSSGMGSHHPQATVGVAPPEVRCAEGVSIRLQYPTLRVGGDSLQTIPEDSTGFVLVTRPSSIACEHGPQCECWAWSAGGAGGSGSAGGTGGVVIRSPSASYVAAPNPYGGPGKSAASAEHRQRGGGGGGNTGPSFLGLGNIWNTAINTFRGVAGVNSRRTSWPRRAPHVESQTRPQRQPQQAQQHRGALAKIPPPNSLPGVYSSGASPPSVMPPGGEHLSPHRVQQLRNMSRVGTGGGSSPGHGGGTRTRSRSLGSLGGDAGYSTASRKGSESSSSSSMSTSSSSPQRKVAPVAADLTSRHGSLTRSPDPEFRTSRVRPRAQNVEQHWHHQRRHSDPISRPPDDTCARHPHAGVPQQVPVASSARGQVEGEGSEGRWTQAGAGESRRVRAAAERAEVVGKRSILVVTLADKTAQEALSLALESPRDARGGEGVPSPENDSSGDLHASRRHDMLTEALSLYMRALAMLQSTLPVVHGECKGLAIEESHDHRHPYQQDPQAHLQQQQQYHQLDADRFMQPSATLLNQRSALVTKVRWLKELFSQILQRANHCQAQIAAIAMSLTSAGQSHASPTGQKGSTGGHGINPHAPWATLGSTSTGVGASGLPSSDIAAAAVYRSAVEHGQEAAVCYLLGRSDAAVAHYVRACKLLQLLALEPEMAGASVRKEESCDGGAAGASTGPNGSWRAQLLLMADGYARRVELISRGVDMKGVGDRVQGEGATEGSTGEDGGGATVPAGFLFR